MKHPKQPRRPRLYRAKHRMNTGPGNRRPWQRVRAALGFLGLMLLTACLPESGVVESRTNDNGAGGPGKARTQYSICVRDSDGKVGCKSTNKKTYDACTPGERWPDCAGGPSTVRPQQPAPTICPGKGNNPCGRTPRR